jgi:MoaA/NifB/PqqE/SkfB family radical SAM enzyme
MQHYDSRINEAWTYFDNLNKEKNTSFTIEDFKVKLEYELTSNPRVKVRTSLTAALDYLTISENLPLNAIAGFIHNVLSEESLYNKPLVDFKFNNKRNCCIAPYSTLNFDTSGKIRVCCYNNYFVLGTYPQSTIRKAWYNPERQKFIDILSRPIFPKGCEKCKLQAVTNNINNALFTKFNVYESIVSDMPVNMEFEFGNICNYECIMCGGKWSSSIRKNREKLPPIIPPYDERFIEELDEFINHLSIVNFLGGEPFLTPLYYRIWDKIINKKPSISIYVTTNGSILSNKVIHYLTNSNMKIVVSLDSLKKHTYELIRKNSNFDIVIKNIKELISMQKLSAIAFCPMIQNVDELPDVARFCIKNNISLYINTVTKPLGGKIKGIHEGEQNNTSVWTGNDDSMEQVKVASENLIPEFCLHSLNDVQLDNIVAMLSKHIASLSDNISIQSQYIDFVNSIIGYKYKKPNNV